MDMEGRKRVAWLPRVPALAGVLMLAGCVSQQQYDDAHLQAKHYQKESIRLGNERDRLSEENMRLRAQLEASDIAISDAGYTERIDERLKSLNAFLREKGTGGGPVERFDVDGGYVYLVTDKILFALGSAEVSEEGRAVLDQVAADIRSKPYGKVHVRGHTDNVPVSRPETRQRFPHGNIELSAMRAVQVAAHLTEKGRIDDGRVVVLGFGPSEPLVDNSTEANRQRNRRVEIFVADAPDSSTASGGK